MTRVWDTIIIYSSDIVFMIDPWAAAIIYWVIIIQHHSYIMGGLVLLFSLISNDF